MVNKCATSGCHNSISRANAGGIDFSSWDKMFEGGRNGSSVIPFSPDYSYLLYFINTDSLRGPTLLPTMPLSKKPLTNEEYSILYNWILKGAPNENNYVNFTDNPSRKKVYICMQGCDQVAVMDANSKVIMRYIPVGVDPGQIEAPHLVRVSPDGQFWYVVFYSGHVLQKFRTSDDSYVGSVEIGQGDWNTIIFTPDGSHGFVNGTTINTSVYLDLDNMISLQSIPVDFPHGGFVTPDAHYLYLTSQLGNFISRIDLEDPFFNPEQFVIAPGENPSTTSRYDPHEMILSPDGSKFYVSCQKSNEIRIFRRERDDHDSLVKIIQVGGKPQEFSLSENHPYLFVTCTEDSAGPGKKGSVYVINYLTDQIVTSIYTGYQPHGLAVDDDHDCVYVANLNYDSNGPAPHHVTTCGGRNGYMTIIDMSTLQLYRKSFSDGSSFEYKTELLSFPYFVSYRN